VTHNEVMNTQTDAGIYVGQSERVAVTNNHVHDNLLGIEVENSVSCDVTGNVVHGNTFGIFIDILPFLERQRQEDTSITGNQVYDNNRPNTAEPDELLGLLPPGIGILITGADRTLVSGNAVTGNHFAGIGVNSLCLAFALQGIPCAALTSTRIRRQPHRRQPRARQRHHSGRRPAADALRADIVWDGTGAGNCWQGNTYATSVPAALRRAAGEGLLNMSVRSLRGSGFPVLERMFDATVWKQRMRATRT
jgi:parallel beta-helix repeat protein